jgi:Xaa-Pro aminopeptidase
MAVPLKVGHLISNEPGYYEDGRYGIRIESLITVKEVKTDFNFGGVKYFGFETITQVPLCQNLMDLKLLTAEEKQWINDYHAMVATALRPYLKDDGLALAWLERQTKPLPL